MTTVMDFVFENKIDALRAAVVADPSIVHSLDEKGLTPMHLAVEKGYSGIIKILAKTDVTTLDALHEKTGKTPLHLAAETNAPIAVKMINLLMKLGCKSLETRDASGFTPIHSAVKAGSTENFKVLMNHCANLETIDNHKANLYHHAAVNELIDVLVILLDNGVVGFDDHDKTHRTPFACAVQTQKQHSMLKLFEWCADVKDFKRKRGVYDFIDDDFLIYLESFASDMRSNGHEDASDFESDYSVDDDEEEEEINDDDIAVLWEGPHDPQTRKRGPDYKTYTPVPRIVKPRTE